MSAPPRAPDTLAPHDVDARFADASLGEDGGDAVDASGGDERVIGWEGGDVDSRPDSAEGGASSVLLFSDDFEDDALGAVAGGWSREGGSAGDWSVASDPGHVFGQLASTSSTVRSVTAGPAADGARTLSARLKLTLGTTAGNAAVCFGSAAVTTGAACVVLRLGAGVQLQTAAAAGPLWPANVVMGVWYDVRLGVETSGLLSATVNGVQLGTLQPQQALGPGRVALRTQSAEAVYDDVVLTAP